MEIKDINGEIVRLGSVVKVLGFEDGIFTTMPEEEIPYVKSMLGEELEVEEIDEHGIAWVWKS